MEIFFVIPKRIPRLPLMVGHPIHTCFQTLVIIIHLWGGKDNWGDYWTPNTSNIMSYSSTDCFSFFTPMQVAKMTYYKNTIGISYPAFTITGPDRLCAGETATYSVTSLPGVTEYDWQVPSSMYITSSPPYGNSISVYATQLRRSNFCFT